MSLTPDDPRHGTYNAYTNHRCRCDPCTVANREYAKRLRKKNGLPPSHRAINLAQHAAVGWVRTTQPAVWQALVNDAYASLGLERQPVGARHGVKP